MASPGDDELVCCVCLVPEAQVGAARSRDGRRLRGLHELTGREIRARVCIVATGCSSAHCVCLQCMHRMATSFAGGHLVNAEHPMIRCPYPFGACVAPETGTPNYIPHAHVERLLTEPEKAQYRAHCERFQFPGFELMRCPRPFTNGPCNAGILVPLERVRRARPGELVVLCDQTAECWRKTCYHCRGLVRRDHRACLSCVDASENENPGAMNRYFYRPGKVAGDGQPPMYRNEELSEHLVVAQILELCRAEHLELRCLECLTFMYKTEQCNTMEHCGLERCYVCGRSGTRSQPLGDHWDSRGARGCPRYDTSMFWNAIGCEFVCEEGRCYGDVIGPCAIPEHQPGIKSLVYCRKRGHVYHALRSLLPGLRELVLHKLWMLHPETREYLPRCWSKDHRTYLPDELQRLRENDGESEVGTECAGLEFVPIAYPEVPKRKPRRRKRYDELFAEFRERYVPRQRKR